MKYPEYASPDRKQNSGCQGIVVEWGMRVTAESVWSFSLEW